MTIDVGCPFKGDLRIYGPKVSDRIEEIEGAIDGYDDDLDEEAIDADIALTELLSKEDVKELRLELVALRALVDECPKHFFLIREDNFEEYASEFAEEIGALKESSWPHNHIDWEEAAKALQQDYSSTTFMGTHYFYNPNQ